MANYTSQHPRLPYSATVIPALAYELTEIHVNRNGHKTIVECNTESPITQIWVGENLYLWGSFLGGKHRPFNNIYMLDVGMLGTTREGLSGTTCIAASHHSESLLVCDGINIGRIYRGEYEYIVSAPYGKWCSISEPASGIVALNGFITHDDWRIAVRDDTLIYDIVINKWYYGEYSDAISERDTTLNITR